MGGLDGAWARCFDWVGRGRPGRKDKASIGEVDTVAKRRGAFGSNRFTLRDDQPGGGSLNGIPPVTK